MPNLRLQARIRAVLLEEDDLLDANDVYDELGRDVTEEEITTEFELMRGKSELSRKPTRHDGEITQYLYRLKS